MISARTLKILGFVGLSIWIIAAFWGASILIGVGFLQEESRIALTTILSPASPTMLVLLLGGGITFLAGYCQAEREAAEKRHEESRKYLALAKQNGFIYLQQQDLLKRKTRRSVGVEPVE